MDFGNINEIIKTISLMIVPFLFAVTIHEFMHGFVAYKLGDNTAKDAGRLTLNPISHIDPLGLIVLVLTRMIGWAKPVPVNYYNLRHKYGVAIVSVAGPLGNLVTAFLSGVILKLLFVFAGSIPAGLLEPLALMARYSIFINLALFIFNLIPIMPMDGARIIWNFLPRDKAYAYESTEKYYFLIILLLIITNVLSMIIQPLVRFFTITIYKILNIPGIL